MFTQRVANIQKAGGVQVFLSTEREAVIINIQDVQSLTAWQVGNCTVTVRNGFEYDLAVDADKFVATFEKCASARYSEDARV